MAGFAAVTGDERSNALSGALARRSMMRSPTSIWFALGKLRPTARTRTGDPLARRRTWCQAAPAVQAARPIWSP